MYSKNKVLSCRSEPYLFEGMICELFEGELLDRNLTGYIQVQGRRC
jgi:hypothetical protein